MATTLGTFNFYESFLDFTSIDLVNDSFVVQAHTSAYIADASIHQFQSDLSNELPTANGYTSGGLAITQTWIRAGGTTSFDSEDPLWNATGGDLTARTWVLIDVTPGSPAINPLVGYGLFNNLPADVTAIDGTVLSLQINAGGWFNLTRQ